GELTILGLQKSVLNKRYDAVTDRYSNDAPVDAAMNDLTIAYYQTAYEMFKAHTFDLAAP
ncbi:MAG: hypothetical protein ACRET4_05235, partial [Steroidobacteraceae bacterium]